MVSVFGDGEAHVAGMPAVVGYVEPPHVSCAAVEGADAVQVGAYPYFATAVFENAHGRSYFVGVVVALQAHVVVEAVDAVVVGTHPQVSVMAPAYG